MPSEMKCYGARWHSVIIEKNCFIYNIMQMKVDIFQCSVFEKNMGLRDKKYIK